MKIAVFSDTHGSVSRLPLIKASLKDIDAVLHLGDLAPDGAKIASELGVPCYAVLGNCDYTHGGPYERVETLGGVRMFLTHGHRYLSPYTIALAAMERDCSLALFGHTHIPLIAQQDGCLLVNPGSFNLPRGGSKPGYAILTLKNGAADAELHSLSL